MFTYTSHHNRIASPSDGPVNSLSIAPSSLPAERIAILVLQLSASHVLLPLFVIIIIFSRKCKSKRHLYLLYDDGCGAAYLIVSVCFAWILTGVVSCLLFYVHRDRGAPPPQRLCTAQAALLSGVPPMTSLASLALVCSVGGCPTFTQGQASSRRRFYRATTFATPYTAFAVFTAVCAKLGAAHPDEVIRPPHALSCTIHILSFNAIVAAFATAVSLTSVVLFAIKVVLLWREGGDGSSIEDEKHSMSDVDSEGDPNWQLLVRAGMLALCMLGISIVGLVDIVSSARRDVLDVLRAVAAMAVFIIFGTHPGIFGIWLRRATSEPAMHSSSQTLTRATPPPSPSPSPTLAFDPTQGLPFDPALPPVPLLPHDQALLFGPTLTDTDRKRVDSATSAKSARLHAARGAGVQIIERPQDAFGRKGTGWGKGASPAASLFEYSVRSREGIGGDETKL